MLASWYREGVKWWPKRSRQSPPLEGFDPSRRIKSYSADSGYVYQYQFLGFRKEGDETQYVFSFTVARRPPTTVAVRLHPVSLAAWEHEHGREFTSSEGFGLAKMSLKQAFDEWGDLAKIPLEISPDASVISRLAGVLDL